MREFKFRAWHPESGSMIFFDNLKAANDPYISRHLLLLMANKHPDGESLLMQFTGLKDCEGKEIYEWDILQMPVSKTLQVVEHLISAYTCGFVKRDSHGKCYDFGSSLSEATGVVVVGNIYQNPELIEEHLRGDQSYTETPKKEAESAELTFVSDKTFADGTSEMTLKLSD